MKCDRCGNEVEGFEDETGMTAGYYRVTFGSCWYRFSNSHENIVCDDCMHRDERYIKEYGEHYEKKR